MLTSAGTIAPLYESAITELAPAPAPSQMATAAARMGFDSDVPFGGANKLNPGGDYPDGRAAFMTSLYVAYTGCPWLSAPIDAIARTVTAGGLQVLPTSEAQGDVSPDNPPKQVRALQNLLRFCNPHMDIIQLLRGSVTDMGIYGDAFIEVVWLLGLPVALYPLDPATMTVDADEHGVVLGYDQAIDSREVHFEPHQIIHISMDAPKGSLYGMGIAQKALLPVTIWLFTAACIKETMRKGDPPHIHMDFPLEVQPDEVRAWRGQYSVRNLGTANIGNPITTRGGATLNELGLGKIGDYLAIQDSCRDTILSEAGVPPAKVGVIDSGNIGGGTGTSQDKTFKVNTCGPIEQILLEKLNFALTREAFKIEGWEIVFAEVDWRDDKVVEDIRDMRLHNGSWTLNDYLAEIGKPTIGPAGDVHVLIDRQNLVLWEQIADLSQAKIDSLVPPDPGPPDPGQPDPDDPDAADDGAGADQDSAAPPKKGPSPASPPPSAAGTRTAKAPAPSTETARRYRARVTEHYRRLVAAGAAQED
jgi:hypothetical protein